MSKKKNTKNVLSNYILPSDNKELQSFASKNKISMMEQIVNSIEYALENNLDLIEVFQFKNSNFVITLSTKDYLINLDNIFSYYMKSESYEYCSKVIQLQNYLKNKSPQ